MEAKQTPIRGDLFVRDSKTGELKRNKGHNSPEYNKKANKRREKAKHDAKSKKANQKVARRRRK